MKRLTTVVLAVVLVAPVAAMDQVSPRSHGKLEVYEETKFGGRRLTLDQERRRAGIWFDVRSVQISPGDRWLLCNRTRFRGPCVVVESSMTDLSAIGAAGTIASVRPLPRAPRR